MEAARGMAALASSWDAGEGEVDCMRRSVSLIVNLVTSKLCLGAG